MAGVRLGRVGRRGTRAQTQEKRWKEWDGSRGGVQALFSSIGELCLWPVWVMALKWTMHAVDCDLPKSRSRSNSNGITVVQRMIAVQPREKT